MEVIGNDVASRGWGREYAYQRRGEYFIYTVKCTANQKVYVGRTVFPKNRLRCHASALRNGHHHNKAMQADYDKYGEECFVCEILFATTDRWDRSEGNTIEALRAYDPAYGYNDDPLARKLRREHDSDK